MRASMKHPESRESEQTPARPDKRPGLEVRRSQRDLLTSLRGVAEAAREVARVICSWLPVGGEPWVFAGNGGDVPATILIIHAVSSLEELLYPPESPHMQEELKMMSRDLGWELPPGQVSMSAVARVSMSAVALVLPPEIRLQPLLFAVLAVMNCHERVMAHYGWVTNPPEQGCWYSSDPPPVIDPDLPRALAKAAGILDDLIKEYLAALDGGAPPDPQPDGPVRGSACVILDGVPRDFRRAHKQFSAICALWGRKFVDEGTLMEKVYGDADDRERALDKLLMTDLNHKLLTEWNTRYQVQRAIDREEWSGYKLVRK
jgi:hypothetical protein